MERKTEYIKYCQACGKQQAYGSQKELSRAVKNNSLCRPCANRQAKNFKGYYREIPLSWFEEKKRSATNRGKEFNIDIEYVWSLYIRQNKKCALSGLPLDFNKETDNSMVSIDRIDNNKGYVKRNIQLLHKTINYMKYTYSQKEFIKMCNLVTEKNKDNG